MAHQLSTFYQFPEIVRRGVCDGVRKLHTSIPDRDFEDMLQFAWGRVWQYARDKPERYQFVTARTAAYAWFFRFDLEGRSTLENPVTVSRHRSLEEMETEDGELNLAGDVVEERIGDLPVGRDELVELLAQTRPGYHSIHEWQRARSREAATKDARIIELLAQGYTNFGIAHEMGMSADQVRARRSKIRRALEGILESEAN